MRLATYERIHRMLPGGAEHALSFGTKLGVMAVHHPSLSRRRLLQAGTGAIGAVAFSSVGYGIGDAQAARTRSAAPRAGSTATSTDAPAPPTYVSEPALEPPTVTVTTKAKGTAPGLILTTANIATTQHGPLVIDDDGSPVWFRPLTSGTAAFDLRAQTYQGQPVLTWWEGAIDPTAGWGRGTYLIADTSYRIIGRVQAAAGLFGDLHDFNDHRPGYRVDHRLPPNQRGLDRGGRHGFGTAPRFRPPRDRHRDRQGAARMARLVAPRPERVVRTVAEDRRDAVGLPARQLHQRRHGRQPPALRPPHGGAFVGWGQLPNLTEFAPDGSVRFDAAFPTGGSTYRAYRVPWSARPHTSPSVVAQTDSDTTTVYVSWNGATDVERWQLLGGSDDDQLAPITNAARSGFETAMKVDNAPAFVAVAGLDHAGHELGRSRAVRT